MSCGISGAGAGAAAWGAGAAGAGAAAVGAFGAAGFGAAGLAGGCAGAAGAGGCCANAALKQPAESIVTASAATAALRTLFGRAHTIAYVIRNPHLWPPHGVCI